VPTPNRENTQHGAADRSAQLQKTLIRQGFMQRCANVCREFPANIFARQSVRKGVDFFPNYFLSGDHQISITHDGGVCRQASAMARSGGRLTSPETHAKFLA
jgi:hypothetical protein